MSIECQGCLDGLAIHQDGFGKKFHTDQAKDKVFACQNSEVLPKATDAPDTITLGGKSLDALASFKPKCNLCDSGWPRFKLGVDVYHSLPEPASQALCTDPSTFKGISITGVSLQNETMVSFQNDAVKTKSSHERFNEIIEESIASIRKLSLEKGGEYAGDTDRLANFRRNAAEADVPMELIWRVYAAKHWDAVMQYEKDLRTGKTRPRSEPITGRIDDLIVYLLLLKLMYEERHNANS